jgi:hypothetical protein
MVLSTHESHITDRQMAVCTVKLNPNCTPLRTDSREASWLDHQDSSNPQKQTTQLTKAHRRHSQVDSLFWFIKLDTTFRRPSLVTYKIWTEGIRERSVIAIRILIRQWIENEISKADAHIPRNRKSKMTWQMAFYNQFHGKWATPHFPDTSQHQEVRKTNSSRQSFRHFESNVRPSSFGSPQRRSIN